MARPHIESIRAYDVPAEDVADGLLAGARRRLLSEDDADGSSTSLVTFPAGWTGDLAGTRPVELFLLTGSADLGGQALRPGTWAWVPTAADGARLSLAEASDVLVMVEPERPNATGPVEVVDSVTRSFEPSKTDVPPGLVVKDLRHDPETRDRSWVAGSPPGWIGYKGEIHPTVEEAFLIRGDCFLANSGEMRAGDYFWRPGGVHHGPFSTREGQLFFFRTKGGGMAVEFDEVPDWPERMRDYYDAEPYFVPHRRT